MHFSLIDELMRCHPCIKWIRTLVEDQNRI